MCRSRRSPRNRPAQRPLVALAVMLCVAPAISSCRQIFDLNAGADASVTKDGREESDSRLDAVLPRDAGDSGLDGSPGCRVLGASCVESRDCCSGWCLADKGLPSICVAPNGCLPNGTACRFAAQCCSMACVQGICAADPVCGTNNAPCSTQTDCCSNFCEQDKCRHPDVCRPAGDDCRNDADCCSHLCLDLAGPKSQCALLPGCRPQGEICTSGRNCCSGACQATRQGLNRCVQDPQQACKAMGEVCDSNTECCSLRCRDLDGTTKRCQPAGGCRQTGERCDDRIWACCSGLCEPSDDGTLRCSDDRCLHEGQVCERDDQCCAMGPGACRNVSEGGRYCRSLPDDQCIGSGLDCTRDDLCCDGYCVPTAASASLRCSGPEPACLGVGSLCSGSDQCCSGLFCRRLFTETICTQ